MGKIMYGWYGWYDCLVRAGTVLGTVGTVGDVDLCTVRYDCLVRALQ